MIAQKIRQIIGQMIAYLNVPLHSPSLLRVFAATAAIFTASLASALAEPPLPLSQAVSEALSGSPSLQKAASAKEQSQWKRTEALSEFLPTVSGSANYLFDKKYAFIDVNLGAGAVTFPQVIPTASYNLSARLPLFDGFAAVNRYRSAGKLAESSDQDFNWARFSLERQIILLYYKALAAHSLEEVARQNVNTLEDHLKDVKNFKRAGISTNFDVLRVEVQVSEAHSALLDASDNVAIARQKLAEAMGMANDSRAPQGGLPALTPKAIASLQDFRPEHRADIESIRARVNSAEYLENAAGLFWVPKIYAFGDFQHYNNRDNSVWSKNAFRDAYQVGLGLSWNIFDGMASYARSKQAVEAQFQAEKNLQIAQLHSHQDFDVWRRKFLYSCSVYNSRQSDVQKSKESVRLAREARRVGARTNTDLLDAEAESFRAQAGLVNAQIGAIEALLNLELATGQKIYNFY